MKVRREKSRGCESEKENTLPTEMVEYFGQCLKLHDFEIFFNTKIAFAQYGKYIGKLLQYGKFTSKIA